MGQTSELGLPLFLILCGILGMLLLAIAIIVFFMVYQKRLFAQKRNIQEMETAYQKDLLKNSFEAQEIERKRIASDLHDSVGSILSATRLYVYQLKTELPTDDYHELKNETTSLIDTAINQVRGISHNLFPPNLERFGLLQASQDLCLRIQKVNNIQIDVNSTEEPPLTQLQKLALYRILQELISNTLKHAQAKRIQLHFENDNSQFRMIYQDDGKGFDFEENKKVSNGLGIKSIESRVISIGASIFIQSKLNNGMIVKIGL